MTTVQIMPGLRVEYGPPSRAVEGLLNMQDELVRISKELELMKLPVVYLVPVMTELDIAISRYRREVKGLGTSA